jgi:rhamnosyltransferase
VSGTGGPTADNVVAVVVTLQPENNVIQHVETLIGQVVGIVVIDNGSGPGAASILDSISALPSVEVIRNPINAGIARALNQGAQAAMDVGADWLLTLDQDAAPSAEIVRIAGHTFDNYPQPHRIAVIGSTSTSDLARSMGAASRGRPWIEASAVITAGSFISLAGFRAIGGFRDDLFVDYVDIEFCLRARASGYRVLASRAPTMTHRIGQPTVRSIGRRAVTPTNHSAVRRYYITRNRLLVWRRYCRTDSRFVAQDILASQRELLKVLLFEENRKSKVRAMLAGIMDGLRGSTGVGWTDPGLRTASTANSSRTRRPQ